MMKDRPLNAIQTHGQGNNILSMGMAKISHTSDSSDDGSNLHRSRLGQGRGKQIILSLFLSVLLGVLEGPASGFAQETMEKGPLISINMEAVDPPQFSSAIQILILLTVLSLAPAIFIMVTCFIRIVIVLAFLRQALGIQQSPPNQVIISLALFLTVFIMSPTFQRVNAEALQPYLTQEISQAEALGRAEEPVRGFMLRQVREKDLSLFVEIAKVAPPEDISSVPTYVIIPAFMISELRTAFQIGFLVYLPFLIIDLVIASILMSVGMMMLPPIMISLPFKLILFVLADGWYLIVGSLVRSFE